MFKDYVAEDIKNTFFNIDEFAEETNINGILVNVAEDSERLQTILKEGVRDSYGDLVIGDVLFFISAEEYAKIPGLKEVPTANQALRYKGKPCTITKVNTLMGVYEIVLQTAGG